MLKVRVSAVVAAVLLMSSVSAQAMEFADRPGIQSDVISSAPAIPVMSTDDYSRRQINNLNILLPITVAPARLVERPKPISNIILIKMTYSEGRQGRLSAEFTRVARGSGIRFEYGPGVVANWLKSAATSTAMKFEDRPGTVSNHVTAMPTASIKFADRGGFTSSIAKVITRPGMRPRLGSAGFCVGSMAPCGVLIIGEHVRRGVLSTPYHDARL